MLDLRIKSIATFFFSVIVNYSLIAQETDTPLVWQMVTFDVLPGEYQNMMALYENEALMLYQDNEAILRFRGFREVESPISFGLMVLTEMNGMAGMDASNIRLREIATEKSERVGSLYGRISALTT